MTTRIIKATIPHKPSTLNELRALLTEISVRLEKMQEAANKLDDRLQSLEKLVLNFPNNGE